MLVEFLKNGLLISFVLLIFFDFRTFKSIPNLSIEKVKKLKDRDINKVLGFLELSKVITIVESFMCIGDVFTFLFGSDRTFVFTLSITVLFELFSWKITLKLNDMLSVL